MTQVEGFDEFENALRRAGEIAAPYAEAAIGQVLSIIHQRMNNYPPQPDRDRANPGDKPSPYNTYVRGIGHFPRSSFKQVNGVWERKKRKAYRPGPRGGKVHRTSENLQNKWRIKVTRRGLAVEGELRNEASYSGSVLGHRQGYAGVDDGIPTQAPYHADTGWPNVDDTLAQAENDINQAMTRALDQVMQTLAAGR